MCLSIAKAEEVAPPHPNWMNVAAGKKVQFGTAPNYPDVTDPDDIKQLVDGRVSTKHPLWYDKSIVGWMGPLPVEITVDLGEITPIRGVALRVGAGKAGVAWPQQIQVYMSDNGKQFSPVGDLMKLTPKPPPHEGYDVLWLRADDLKTHGRYVKFVVTPTDSGAGVYFFTDEMQIYKGDKAFLALPLPEAEKSGNPDSPRPQWENVAHEKDVKFDTAPNDPGTSDAEDAKQLVDGRLSAATPLWSDKSAIGWAVVDPTIFTVDLGSVQPIRGLALHLGAGQAGVEWPASVQIYVSETGDKFSPVGDLMQLLAEQPPASGYAASWLLADKLETHGRYVKFVCSPRNLGNGAYIFADELEIYRGEDAWLTRQLAAVDSPQQWSAVWPEMQWQDHTASTPEAERPRHLLLIDGDTQTGGDAPLQQALVEAGAVTFAITGQAGKPRSMSWTANLPKPVSTENCRYAVLTFQAEGIRKTYEPRALVALHGINDRTAEGAITLLSPNMAPGDGRTHTLVTQLPEGFTLQQIKVALFTEDDKPRLRLERLELLSEMPEVFGADITDATSGVAAGFVPVDLGAVLNGNLAAWNEQTLTRHKTVLNGTRALKAGAVSVSGVPFVIASEDKNLAIMPESKPSDERVEFLGQMVDRRYLEPESRHDTLSVEVDAQAREAFLLLALSASPVQVLGGQPHTPLHLDDIESLSIELTYDRGDSEIAFPYSLADKGCFIPARAIGAYAVALDPSRKLKKITLHNRQFGPSFALAGLTLNTSGKALVPELAAIPVPEQTRQNPEPANQPLAVTHQGNRLTIKNRWYEYGIDLTRGFVIDRVVNRWNGSADIMLSPTSGLRVRVGDTIYTGRCFKSEVVRATRTGAELKLTSTRPELPLELSVTISADDSPELAFVVRTKNVGDKPLSPEVCLPAVDGLALGDAAQTRIFFPQYRNVDTAETIALRAPYGPEYTTQFMDVYSRPAGMGLMIRTSNMLQQMVDYTLRKDEGGVSGGVCFPAGYNVLEAGASREYIPVSLIAHGGDWRAAFALYRDWLRTWYKPYRSQDKDYFTNAWEIACYRTSIHLSWLEQRTPPFISEDRKKFMVDDVYAFEKRTRGHNADLVHFYNWSYNDTKKANDYGVHSTPAVYQHVGGIEFFRKGIDDIQTRLKTPVSLYTVIDRFRASLVPDPALAKELVDTAWHQEPDKESDVSSHVRGSTTRDGTYFVRLGHERWTDFVIQDIVKMQRDTGCKMVYIDVYAYWSHLQGHNGASPREADLKVLKRLKDLLPPDVVLWSEYPPTDFASQYHDGSLQYYFLPLNEVFTRRYNDAGRSHNLIREMPMNIARYSLPRYKSIGLAGYIEASNSPSQVDAMFVNGEANQEDTWRLHHSRIREKLNRAYDVKHAYNDCFNGPDPLPRVDTAAEGIVANCFTGKKRTLWTLFNARPTTYSGVVLSVPHKTGAKYRDAWNDNELSPVIENGVAKIAVRIDPQQPGCVVQYLN